MDNERKEICKNLSEIRAKLQEKFVGLNQGMPSNLAQNISSLEIELERLEVDLNRVRGEIKGSEELLIKYNRDLETLRGWVKSTEAKLEEESEDPTKLKENVQVEQLYNFPPLPSLHISFYFIGTLSPNPVRLGPIGNAEAECGGTCREETKQFRRIKHFVCSRCR